MGSFFCPLRNESPPSGWFHIKEKIVFNTYIYIYTSVVILIYPFSSVLNFHLFVAFEMKSEISEKVLFYLYLSFPTVFSSKAKMEATPLFFLVGLKKKKSGINNVHWILSYFPFWGDSNHSLLDPSKITGYKI